MSLEICRQLVGREYVLSGFCAAPQNHWRSRESRAPSPRPVGPAAKPAPRCRRLGLGRPPQRRRPGRASSRRPRHAARLGQRPQIGFAENHRATPRRWCLLADVLPPPRCCLRRLPRAVNGRATRRRAAAKGHPGTMAEPRPNDRSGRQPSKIMLGFQGAQPVGRWRQPVPASCTVVLKGRFLWQPFSEDAKFERSEEP